jgi:hypothetical protein
MTIFELVKIALDQLYAEGTEQHHANLDKEIIRNIDYLSESYKHLSDRSRSAVNYQDPATRFAYVYRYVAAHGDYVVQVLEKLARTGHRIFATDNVRVSCLGGGPGSDIVGVLKYLDENRDEEPVQKLTCYLLDREQAWADIWTELNESLTSVTNVNVPFQPFDITDVDSWKSQRKFLQADLFTMIYFVSEVLAFDKNEMVAKSWRKIFDSAKSGAFFLYLDNGHSDFTYYFDKLYSDAKLKCLLSRG